MKEIEFYTYSLEGIIEKFVEFQEVKPDVKKTEDGYRIIFKTDNYVGISKLAILQKWADLHEYLTTLSLSTHCNYAELCFSIFKP
jgi:hypothetical protein